MYVTVHVPRKSTKHKHHKSRKRHNRNGSHSHHVDRSHSNTDYTDYDSTMQGYHGDPQGSLGNTLTSHSDVRDGEGHPIYSPQESVGFETHKPLHGTASDMTYNSSSRSSINGRPRYHKSHSLPQRAADLSIPEIVTGEGGSIHVQYLHVPVHVSQTVSTFKKNSMTFVRT